MTTTEQVPRVRKTWWGHCPDCYRERCLTPKGLMVIHRKWITGKPFGNMVHCPGSGYAPLLEVTTLTKEENNARNAH